MKFPRMFKVRQRFSDDHISDIEGVVKEQILSSEITIKSGSRIAIAVGSRGVANINRVVKATVESVREMGGLPFIVPAMGSHGGATAEGQRSVLEGYGVTEKYVGAQIISSMQVVELPQENLINKVYMDRHAYEADGTIIINRIKVHTDFHGPTESGLMKMCVIGLGKHKQALEIHRHGVYGLRELIPPTARQVLKHGNIILGIGLVENAYDETVKIKAVKPEELEAEEMKLLEYNRRNMPKLPVDKIDVLIVDEIGKNISGTGMDTNIIGRIRISSCDEPESPKITNIVATDLTEESHGNALGMGLADFITSRLESKIDFEATYENTITSTFIQRASMPIVAETSKMAVRYALMTCGPVEAHNARIVRIKNTLKLDEFYVSESVLNEIKENKDIEIIGEYNKIFDGNGELNRF